MNYSYINDDSEEMGVWITGAIAALKGAGKGIGAISKAIRKKKKKKKKKKTDQKPKQAITPIPEKKTFLQSSQGKTVLYAGAGVLALLALTSLKR